MLKLFLWFRYLRKKKIVFLSIAAVALSVALLLVVSSLFGGFIDAFEQSAVDVLGDVVIAPPVKFAKYPVLIESLEQGGVVKAATAILSSPGLLHLGKGNVRAVVVWGIEPQSRAEVTGFKESLVRQKELSEQLSFAVPGQPMAQGGFVGIGVVAEPDKQSDEYDFAAVEAMVGEKVVVTTGAVKETDTAEQKQFKRRTIRFAISDIVFAGSYYVDKTFIYLPIGQLQKTLYPDSKLPIASQIQIKLSDKVRESEGLVEVRGIWERFAAEELGWSERMIEQTVIDTAKRLQSPYVAEFRKQMGVLLLIFGVISLSAVLLIFCIFYMIVETKQKDIAIIKSCGATSYSAASIFLGFGGCVGIVGSVLGIGLGVIVIKNINAIEQWIRIAFGLKLWKSSVYLFSRIPNEIDWSSAITIGLCAIAAAAIGALIPAIVAVRTRPVNVLRYE